MDTQTLCCHLVVTWIPAARVQQISCPDCFLISISSVLPHQDLPSVGNNNSPCASFVGSHEEIMSACHKQTFADSDHLNTEVLCLGRHGESHFYKEDDCIFRRYCHLSEMV